MPRLWKHAAVSGLRTRARTLAARVLRYLMAALPSWPVAPMTRILSIFSTDYASPVQFW
jgi:hypothetical protein